MTHIAVMTHDVMRGRTVGLEDSIEIETTLW